MDQSTQCYYQNLMQLSVCYSQRMLSDKPLTEYEALMYEQLCRLLESMFKNFRERIWDPNLKDEAGNE